MKSTLIYKRDYTPLGWYNILFNLGLIKTIIPKGSRIYGTSFKKEDREYFDREMLAVTLAPVQPGNYSNVKYSTEQL